MTYRLHTALANLFILILILGMVSESAADSGAFTLWPLVDYRYSTEDDFHSWKFLGPFLKYEKNGAIRQRAFRPLYYQTDDLEKGSFRRDILFPISTRKSTSSDNSYHVLILLNNYKLFNKDEPDDVKYQTFTLFPFIYYGKNTDGDSYFAFLPFGGTIKDRLQRDEITFFLWPLYIRTERNGTTIRNVPWPIYANIRGENESGTKIWPLWGASEKTGVYKKRFFLWPFFFKYDLKLDTDNPEKVRTFFPFYVWETSPKRSSKHILWPFFSHIQDHEKGYDEWNYPWPLFRRTTGEYKQSVKYLPFYADERVGEYRKRWYLWPIYKIEEINSDDFTRRRDRVLYFLYSNLDENHPAEPWKNKKRIAFWPIFTYEKKQGITDFYVLSLLEPFFPEGEAIARIWAPLWRVYQHRYVEDRDIEVSSFLWNLYWKERHGKDLAWELFPLVRYRNEKGEKDLKLLKGLFRYQSAPERKKISLFFLPWGIGWDSHP